MGVVEGEGQPVNSVVDRLGHAFSVDVRGVVTAFPSEPGRRASFVLEIGLRPPGRLGKTTFK